MSNVNSNNKNISPSSNLITIHQINLQHSKLATLELIKQLEGVPRFIVLAQEPYFYNKLMFIPRHIKTISHTSSKPRACIMHHPDLVIFPSPNLVTPIPQWDPGNLG
jgi:hypothetical protein